MMDDWLTCRAECLKCDHRWVAVVEADASLGRLECPRCGTAFSVAYPVIEPLYPGQPQTFDEFLEAVLRCRY